MPELPHAVATSATARSLRPIRMRMCLGSFLVGESRLVGGSSRTGARFARAACARLLPHQVSLAVRAATWRGCPHMGMKWAEVPAPSAVDGGVADSTSQGLETTLLHGSPPEPDHGCGQHSNDEQSCKLPSHTILLSGYGRIPEERPSSEEASICPGSMRPRRERR